MLQPNVDIHQDLLPRVKRKPYRWFCWVDRHSCIVIRNKRAVQLGYIQFAIFNALHSVKPHEGKKLNAKHLADVVYNGAINPSTAQTIRACVYHMNRKLLHVGLKVISIERKNHSFYQIVVLP
jgi:hypothetical protein